MAKNSKLTQAAVKIGAAMGKPTARLHKVVKAGVVAKKRTCGHFEGG